LSRIRQIVTDRNLVATMVVRRIEERVRVACYHWKFIFCWSLVLFNLLSIIGNLLI